MFLSNAWQQVIRLAPGSRTHPGRKPSRRPAPRRLCLEQLEDRCLPSSYTAATVSDLVADINAANAAGGSNTITLVAGKTFTLNAVNNTTDSPTGLPIIATKDNLSIVGNGDTIERSTATGTPAFRLLDVAGGASLTLANLTLQGGLAVTAGIVGSAEGGAIRNQGALILNGVTVQNNVAQGSGYISGGTGAGGGIYSSGSLTLQGCTIQNNQALGGDTYRGDSSGGAGLGGGLYLAGGTASLRSTTVDYNTAKGGKGFRGKAPGLGEGGGLYIDPRAAVCLDAFTQANVTHNKASTAYPNIDGSYTTCP